MDIREIIAAAGGPVSLADRLGCHRTTILKWRQVPVHRVNAVSAATGLPRHRLRPDYWDAPTFEGAATREATHNTASEDAQ